MRGAQKNTAIQLNSELQRVGFETKWSHRNLIRPHSGSETVKHWALKCAICRRISELNDIFFTEVNHPERGIPDILRLKLADERAIVYEVETGCTEEDRRAKARQYTNDLTCPVIQEAETFDPLTAPDSVLELTAWVEERVR